jgi:hypothetical protein
MTKKLISARRPVLQLVACMGTETTLYLCFEPRLQRGLSIRSSVLLAAMQLEAVSNYIGTYIHLGVIANYPVINGISGYKR